MLATLAQNVTPDAPLGLNVSEVGVSLILGLFLPLVLGFILRPTAPEPVKVVGGIVIAGVAALIKEAVQADGSAVLSWEMLVQFALIYGPQIAAYAGVWKPLDINTRTGPGVVG
jgi:hypothetical protein